MFLYLLGMPRSLKRSFSYHKRTQKGSREWQEATYGSGCRVA